MMEALLFVWYWVLYCVQIYLIHNSMMKIKFWSFISPSLLKFNCMHTVFAASVCFETLQFMVNAICNPYLLLLPWGLIWNLLSFSCAFQAFHDIEYDAMEAGSYFMFKWYNSWFPGQEQDYICNFGRLFLFIQSHGRRYYDSQCMVLLSSHSKQV